jgi:hypothetical protein
VSRLLDNLGAAIVGYVAASVAAGFSYALLLAAAVQLSGSIAQPSEMSEIGQLQSLLVFAILAVLLIAAVALVPSALAIGILLLVRQVNVVTCVVAGIAVGAVSVMIAARNVIFMDKLTVDWVIVSASAIAGAAFWMVFSRLAPPAGAR